MNKRVLLFLLMCALANPLAAQAEEAATTTTEPEATQEAPAVTDDIAKLKEKYGFTDEQIQAMKNSKISESQYSMVGVLAKESGKSVEEVLKMRIEQKMGWGKIAKELGVEPKALGQSVSSMHRQEAREARKEERKQKREEKKQARKEERAHKKDKKVQ